MPVVLVTLFNLACQTFISMGLRLFTGEVIEWATVKAMEVGAAHTDVSWDDEAVAKAKEALAKTKPGA